MTLHTKVRRAVLLAYLERGWTSFNAIKVHLVLLRDVGARRCDHGGRVLWRLS
jgi:hypothetical protein